MSSHPSHNLPLELFGKIFVECLPEKDTDRLDPDQAPMVLCRVDSHWRQVAFAEHALWDTIIFPTAYDPTKKYARFIAAGHIDAWFGRAGERSLAFGEEPCYRRSHGSLLNDCIGPVIKYARRFRHLSIVLSKIIHFEWFRRGFPQDIYNRLTSVSISCTMEMNASVLYGFPSLATPFMTAPHLQDVTLTLLRASPRHFILPWESLTRISVDNPQHPLPAPEWRNLFKTCPNLVEAVLVRPDLDPIYARPRATQSLRHDALRRMVLVVPSIHWEHSYLRRETKGWNILASPVTFPSLLRLELQFEEDRCRSGSLVDYAGTSTLSSVETLVLTCGKDREELKEARELVLKMAERPRAFRALKKLVLPYPSSRFWEVVDVLREYPPSMDASSELYPGLTVYVKVLPGRWEYDNWVEAKRTARRDHDCFSRIYLT